MTLLFLPSVTLFLQISGMTEGRTATILPAVLGLITLVIGWVALIRSATHVKLARFLSAAALAMGLPGVLLSVLHLIRANGAIGTGSGRLGATVALILCVIGLVLGVLARSRSGRIAARNDTNLHKSI